MNELTYIELIPFSIKNEPVKWQKFFFIRKLWSYYSNGGFWWQTSIFISVQILFTLPSLMLDFTVLIFEFLIIKIIFNILKGLWLLIQLFLETTIKSFVGKFLSWFAVILILFIVFYLYKSDKWLVIYDIVSDLFSLVSLWLSF